MSTSLQRLLLITILLLAVPAVGYGLESTIHVWTFDNDPPETLPSEFQMGTLFDGRPAGKWKVIETERAKSSPRVLGQLMGKGAEHAYKTLFINGIKASDLALHVSFLPIDGKADMGGGLIWRATDDRNYYLTRANPLEQNIRIYRVVNGVRQMLKNFDHMSGSGIPSASLQKGARSKSSLTTSRYLTCVIRPSQPARLDSGPNLMPSPISMI